MKPKKVSKNEIPDLQIYRILPFGPLKNVLEDLYRQAVKRLENIGWPKEKKLAWDRYWKIENRREALSENESIGRAAVMLLQSIDLFKAKKDLLKAKKDSLEAKNDEAALGASDVSADDLAVHAMSLVNFALTTDIDRNRNNVKLGQKEAMRQEKINTTRKMKMDERIELVQRALNTMPVEFPTESQDAWFDRAAEKVGVEKRTIYRYVQKGKIKVPKK